MKRILIVALTFVLVLSASLTAWAGNETDVPFLLYHSILKEYTPDSNALLHISEENFIQHMQTLKNAGYNTVTLDEYYAYATEGAELPSNPIVICFDDGYLNNYENAYPVLKQMGMKATIFVIASRMGCDTVEYPHFTWEQAVEMENSGIIDIESHSLTHPSFSELNYAETVKEMRLSKYLVEKNLNKECKYMAYPYGFTNVASASVGKAAGYKMLCIVGNSGVNGRNSDLSQLRRLNVSGDMTADILMQYIQSNY